MSQFNNNNNNRDDGVVNNNHVDASQISDASVDPSLVHMSGRSPLVRETTMHGSNQGGGHTHVARVYQPGESHATNFNVPQSTGPSRSQPLLEPPYHNYTLPQGGPINATIVDIITILPQWFRNPGILQRFLNNGLVANVHLAILKEYRHIDLTTPPQLGRARDHLSDTYRKQMRKYFNPTWSKHTHAMPVDWDSYALSITDVTPEAVVTGATYIAPASIPFKDLAIGLKKLPQGDHAGDLTCALDYAMRYQKADGSGHTTDFLFPDDVQLILHFVGRVRVTKEKTDRFIITRYQDMFRENETARRRQVAWARIQQEIGNGVANQPMQQPSSNGKGPAIGYFQPPARNSQAGQNGDRGILPTGIGAPMPTPMHQSHMPVVHQPQMYQVAPQGIDNQGHSTATQFVPSAPDQSPRSPSQEAAASVASKLVSQDLPPIPSICNLHDSTTYSPQQHISEHPDTSTTQQQIEAYIAANQTFNPYALPQWPIPPDMPLRDVAAWFTEDDRSDIALAARWAVEQVWDGTVWRVEDVGMIMGLLGDKGYVGFEGFE
ncbi:hypothetical protein GMOD_00009216 [Pyrenophora seminiperda CCB06]|uniref:Uncharacterized protein n=1 Tax=Pyrenophora seminiperda CCB06 TaxID=1302712 RepID=A0A3M7MBP0_9PLEO|nr:hypothetical protein GMOD_00009216 [Pyrenophora seminiperda CCB06]